MMSHPVVFGRITKLMGRFAAFGPIKWKLIKTIKTLTLGVCLNMVTRITTCHNNRKHFLHMTCRASQIDTETLKYMRSS